MNENLFENMIQAKGWMTESHDGAAVIQFGEVALNMIFTYYSTAKDCIYIYPKGDSK